MLRPWIIRTLLVKEVLRYVHNWGALVVIFALIGLAALIALGGGSRFLPVPERRGVGNCLIRSRGEARAWADLLRRSRPPEGSRLEFGGFDRRPRAGGRWITIDLVAPGEQFPGREPSASWTARVWYPEDRPEAVLPFQAWLVPLSDRFLGRRPELALELHGVASGVPDVLPLAMTGLVAFALYLPAFNLFITSTAEERERRVLLAVLLSPARPVEVLAAKAIFYTLASLLVAMTVVGLYRPALLADPRLWLLVGVGATGYVAIGTVVLSLVRRQTTIGTVSILYLMAVGACITLAEVLPLFYALRLLLIENYLYRQLAQVMIGAPTTPEGALELMSLIMVVVGWMVIATAVFGRRSRAIAQAR
jgi:hypothetical protein